MSSAGSNSSKRVRQAIQGADDSHGSPSISTNLLSETASETSRSNAAPTEDPVKESPVKGKAPGQTALRLHRHRSHSMDNRPVDPSPIQVSHTVSMAGQRPIGVSDDRGPVRFSQSRTILNRPIAPNRTVADDTLLEYLD